VVFYSSLRDDVRIEAFKLLTLFGTFRRHFLVGGAALAIVDFHKNSKRSVKTSLFHQCAFIGRFRHKDCVWKIGGTSKPTLFQLAWLYLNNCNNRLLIEAVFYFMIIRFYSEHDLDGECSIILHWLVGRVQVAGQYIS